jgi:hypothetical protein
MERKHIIIIILGMTLTVSMFVAMYAFSPLNEKLYRASFTRNLIPRGSLLKIATAKIKGSELYISGADDNNIYISSSIQPFRLTILDNNLTNPRVIGFKIPTLDSIRDPGLFKTRIFPPHFYLANGSMGLIMKGDTGKWEAKTFKVDSNTYYFNDVIPINEKSLITQSYSAKHEQSDLAKMTPNDSPHFKFKFGILEKQLDGVICVTGQLHYNKEENKIVYLYSYRNQYTVTDTSLNILYRGNTIDTFRTARLKVENIQNTNTSMVKGGTFVTNIKSCTSGKYLFIHSNILSKDEDEIIFRQSSVIDIYDITKNKYIKSFYIPNHKNNNLADFKVIGKKLLALFDNELVMFELTSKVI